MNKLCIAVIDVICLLVTQVCSFILSVLRKAMARLPKALVFDLDGCCWDPEMYELWGGGSPFKENKVLYTLGSVPWLGSASFVIIALGRHFE